MFTRNFMKCMCTRLFGINGDSNIKAVNTIGDTSSLLNSTASSWNYFSDRATSLLNPDISSSINDTEVAYKFIVKFGTGKTKPTIDDINLENIISSDDLQIVQHFADSTLMDTDQIIKVDNIVSNLTDRDIAINEIGVYSTFYINITSHVTNPCLLWREVLDTPIVAKANKDCKITVRLDFSKING